GLPHLHTREANSRLDHNDDVMQVMRARIRISRRIFRKKVMLRFEQEEERANPHGYIATYIACVRGNTNNLIVTLRAHTVLAEVFSDRILVPEKPLCKRLIDDRYVLRTGRILLGVGASSADGLADSAAVPGSDSVPKRQFT